jgi:serine/threonine protein kinase/tetratricopeptide (TPR) repeat protein
MIGTALSHFRITAKLGEGGMGEVYRAEDTKLGREVAIKVLPAEMANDPVRLERFQREARAIAALNHPNIVSIHSIESASPPDGVDARLAPHEEGKTALSEHPPHPVHFLVMELVEGHTLGEQISARGLPLRLFFELAIAMASAVAAAHAKGVTHRDLKPANVMVNREGHLKVLDFGLAKLTETQASPEMTQMPTEALTQEGLIVGTVPYMAPEQIEGKAVDPRTDIFSLGVIFYEMATGGRPFQGDTSPALMSSILKDVPQPVIEVRSDLPRHLGRILARCLEKDPTHRYSSATDLAYELESLRKEHESDTSSLVHQVPTSEPEPTPAPAPTPPSGPISSSISGTSAIAQMQQANSIAVLPFINRGGKEDDNYFCDGLSEELINALSKLPGLKVTARSSAFQFRGQELDVREVGEKLDVEIVLEGSVRIAGNRLRITTELVNCADRHQLWSERFDGEMKDIFDTQDEIVKAIVDRLQVELGDKPRSSLIERGTENLEAYHLLLKARHHMIDFWEPGFVDAHECLEKAIELDPDYAEAYTVLSENYMLRSIFGSMPGGEAMPLVRSKAQRALELDPTLGEAHKGLAIYQAWHDFDWEKALAEIRLGIENSPHSVWTHFYHAGILATMRRGDEMVTAFQPALELDPLNPIIAAHHALFLFYAGQNDEAEAAAQKGLELFPDYWFHYYMLSYTAFKRREAGPAISNMLRANELTGGDIPWLNCALAAMHFTFGQPEEARQWLNKVEELSHTTHVTPMGRTVIEVSRGNADEAIRWAECAHAEHDTLFAWTRAFCEQVNLIADERVRVALERLGLP